MATTTPNFGWSVPTSTDLVKDGATAIETLGDSIDASLVDLKGGTTGQILAKNSNTDMDFTWSAAGMTNPMTTTGDTIYSSSGSTPARLAIGSTGNVLTVAGGVPTWAAPAGATKEYTLLNAGGTALTGAGTITVNITAYDSLLIYMDQASSVSASSVFTMRFNGDSTTKYTDVFWSLSDATPSVGQQTAGTSAGLGTLGNNAGQDITFVMQVDAGKSTGIKPYWGLGHSGGTAEVSRNVSGYYSGTSAITSVSVISGTGNFDSGTIFIYGA
jgi:hypothetical protein